jgi:L-ascorbate metabolism protein UlaG (beta-lactamase superfamily)
LAAVRPRWVVPVHWDNFFRPLSRPLRPLFMPNLRRADLSRFRRRLEQLAPEVRVIVPELFRQYDGIDTDP